MESIIVTFLFLALMGFLVHLIVTHIPMPAPFSQVIIVVAVVMLVLWTLGVLTGRVSAPSLPVFR